MNEQLIFHRCPLILALIFSLLFVCPANAAQQKKSIWSRIFVFVVRQTYGKPKEVTEEQQVMERLLGGAAQYNEAKARANSSGFEAVPGQLAHYKIPICQVYFLIFKKEIGTEPISVYLQTFKKPDPEDYGFIVVGSDRSIEESSIRGAVFLSQETVQKGFTSDRAKLTEYLEKNLGNCATGCKKRLLDFGCIAQGASVAVANPGVGAATYVLCVVKHPDCGGCALNGVIQSLTEYALAVPLPTKK